MRLRHIEVFHAIQQTGSISRAADFLGVTQPAASKVLRHAESSLGFKLFDRVKGRLQPTVEAQILYLEADKIYRGVEKLRRLAQNLRRHPEGHLRIGCLPSLGLSMIPQAVQNFRKTHPGVTCQIKTDHEEGLIDAILARELDVALTFDAVNTPGVANAVIGRAELVHVGSDSSREEVDLREVRPADYIGIADDNRLGRLLNDAWRAADHSTSPLVTVQTYYVACALAEAGCGSAIVDEFTAHAMLRGNLRIRRLKQRPKFDVVVLSHHGGANRDFCRAFFEIMKHTCSRITGSAARTT